MVRLTGELLGLWACVRACQMAGATSRLVAADIGRELEELSSRFLYSQRGEEGERGAASWAEMTRACAI